MATVSESPRSGDFASGTAAAAPPRQRRLLSLDVLRGLAVMGMILVNSAAGMFYGPKAQVFPILLHAHWDGLMLADVVFPAFLMMVGVSIPFSLRGDAGPQGARIAMRTLRIFLLGLLLSNLYWLAHFDSGEWRLFGVLQRIALVYGACAWLFLNCSPKVRLGIIVGVLILYWPLALVPALDGLPTDIMQRGHNFVGSVDRILLGAGGHNYVQGPEGYDPEGLLGTLPAIAHGLIGVAIGEYLRRQPQGGSARTLAIAGAAMLIAGIVWSFFFPIIKDIWSSSFVLVTCGITTLALALLHHLLDRRERRPEGLLTIPVAFGSNAIAAYVLHMLTSDMVGWDSMLVPYHWARGFLPDQVASLIPIFLYMAILWIMVEWLRRKNWVVKV